MPVALQALPCTRCSSPALSLCALCTTAPYCSVNCSREHWPHHRFTCITTAKPPGLFALNDSPNDAGNGLPSSFATASSPTSVAGRASTSQPTNDRSPRSRPTNDSSPRTQSQAKSREWERPETLSDAEFTKVLVTASNYLALWVNVFRNQALVLRLHSELAAAAAVGLPSCVPHVNVLYAGCYQGQWCRVKVLSVAPTLTVRYIDFGNDEPIAMRDLRALPADLANVRAQAIRLRLREADQKKYERYKVDSVMFVRLVQVAADGAAVVDVEGDVTPAAQTPTQTPTQMPMQTPKEAPTQTPTQMPTQMPAPVPALEIPTQELSADKYTEVVVLEQCNADYWVNVVANGPATLVMLEAMTRQASRWPSVLAPRAGDIVAAEFVDDSGKGWYRAAVRSASPLKVVFVDFGNEATVPAGSLRRLPAEFTALPAQAVKVALMPAAPQRYRHLPANAVFCVRRVQKCAGFVIVEAADVPADKPVAATTAPAAAAAAAPAAAAAAPAAAPADAPASEIPYVELPTNEYFGVTVAQSGEKDYLATVDGNAERSYALVSELTERSTTLAACTPRHGALVAALFCGEWYRARVTQLTPLTVYYVDYGNSGPVNADQIRELPAEMLAMPAQAVKLWLAEGSSPEFHLLPVNTELEVKVVGRRADAYVVQVKGDTPLVVASPAGVKVVEPGDNTLPCLRPKTPPTGSPISVYFASKQGSESYVQPRDSSTELIATEARMAELAPQMPPARPAVGAVVMVLFDNLWSRAQVLSLLPELRVRFLDYGNEADVAAADVRDMPSEFAQTSAQCWKVALSADTPAAVAQLEEYAVFNATFLSQAADSTWTVRGQLE